MRDDSRTKVRERVWVTKIDHEQDPPRVVEKVMVENGRVVAREVSYGEEAEAAAGPDEASDVQGQGNQQVTTDKPKIEPWVAVGLVVEAARESGIDLQRALKFMSLIRMGVQAKGARAPEGAQ